MTRFNLFVKPAGAELVAAVTFTHSGTININPPAMRLIGNPEAVHLLLSDDGSTVAIRPVKAEVPDAYVVRGVRPSGAVSATHFLRHCGLERTGAARRLRAREQDGMLCVDITAPPIPRGWTVVDDQQAGAPVER